MKIHQFLSTNDEFLSKQMKSLSFISEPNGYTQQQVVLNEKNYSQIKFEKPKFRLNISEKFEKIPLLPSDNLKPPKTAPPRTTTSLHVKLSKKRSAAAASNSSGGASTPGSSISNGSLLILKKNALLTSSNKQKDIKEWAFKKLKFEENKRYPEQEQNRSTKNLTQLKYGHQFWYDEVDELNQNTEDVDLAQLENEDEDAEFYRNHRSANLNKALNQKNFTNKLLDAKLIDLSKQRFKDVKQLSYEKKIFARHQLDKAKTLPGLKVVSLLDQLERDEKKAYEQNFEKNDTILKKRNLSFIKHDPSYKNQSTKIVSFASKLNQIQTETINETQRNLSNMPNEYFNKDDSEISVPNSFRSRINSKFSTTSSIGDFLEELKEASKANPTVADKRFFYLINTVKPSYKLGKSMKDVNRIIEKNDALKSINFDMETKKKMQTVKQLGSKLAITARKLLASSDYNYN